MPSHASIFAFKQLHVAAIIHLTTDDILPSITSSGAAQSVTLSRSPPFELIEVRMIVSATTVAATATHVDGQGGGDKMRRGGSGGGAASNLMLTASSLGAPPARASDRANERERVL